MRWIGFLYIVVGLLAIVFSGWFAFRGASFHQAAGKAMPGLYRLMPFAKSATVWKFLTPIIGAVVVAIGIAWFLEYS